MQTVPVFLINLDRRPDRLGQMKAEFGGVGVEFERIPAVDVLDPDEDLAKWRVDPRLPLGPAGLCCLLSHFRAFHRILENGIPLAMVAEDDVELSPDILPLLSSDDWLPDDIGLVQCESGVTGGDMRLVGPDTVTTPVSNRVLRRLYARTYGSGCYLITREAALQVTNGTKKATHIDMLLFNQMYSPVFRKLGVALLMPSIARQTYGVNSSDILHYDPSRGNAKSSIADPLPASGPPVFSHLTNRKTILGRILKLLSELTTSLPYRLRAKAKGARYMAYDFRK